jgi:hypothetical protein
MRVAVTAMHISKCGYDAGNSGVSFRVSVRQFYA